MSRHRLLVVVALVLTGGGLLGSPAWASTAGTAPEHQYYVVPRDGLYQSTPANEQFPQPLVASVSDEADAPAPGKPLTFSLHPGYSAATSTFANGRTSITVTTDADGLATVFLTAGPTPGDVVIDATYPGYVGVAQFGETISPARSTTRVSGSGTLPLGAESATFTLDLTARGGSATGNCQLTGDRGTSIRCTGFSDVRRSGQTVGFRGTALYNGRQPISFTAQVVDGAPDSFVIFAAGQRYGGTLTSGDIAVS